MMNSNLYKSKGQFEVVEIRGVKHGVNSEVDTKKGRVIKAVKEPVDIKVFHFRGFFGCKRGNLNALTNSN